jgi:dienelactone hydrolase
VSWRQAARGLDGSIGFYGSGEALRATVPDLSTLQAPLLLLIAEADPYFPIADSMQIDRELTTAGVKHETVVYTGAPHGFFSSGDWAAVSSDAWERVLRFVRAS